MRSMSTRSWRDWLALLWVAMVAAIVVAVVATFAVFAIFLGMSSPVWDLLLLVPLLSVGLVVGAVAGLRRWWLALPAGFSALGAVAAGAIAAAIEHLPILWVVPGLAAGSLLAVALADRLAGRASR
ncbi:MAG: hypothetical protein EA340_03435, partial [Nitriliruptor sp.]